MADAFFVKPTEKYEKATLVRFPFPDDEPHRRRTYRTKGCLSARSMVFKLCASMRINSPRSQGVFQ